MDVLEAIFARRSINRLVEPGPTRAQLETLLAAAAAAPDHGELRPWHFFVVEGDERAAFGEILAEAARRRGEAAGRMLDEKQFDKERAKLTRAPTTVVVTCRPEPGKIPPEEQFAAVAAATQNLVLAATELGIGSMWRTGEPAHDPLVKAALGLDVTDSIVGFVYLGTVPDGAEKPPRRPDLDGIVTSWTAG